MLQRNYQMSPSEVAAWYGAVLATVVFIWNVAWNVYTWKKTGAIVNVTSTPNCKVFNGISNGLEDKTFIFVEATNTGDSKTTLTHLVVSHYTSVFQLLIRIQSEESGVVLMPALSNPLPYVLEPGERWRGGIIQTKKLEEISKRGYLYCGVLHSSRKRPVIKRVIIKRVKRRLIGRFGRRSSSA